MLSGWLGKGAGGWRAPGATRAHGADVESWQDIWSDGTLAVLGRWCRTWTKQCPAPAEIQGGDYNSQRILVFYSSSFSSFAAQDSVFVFQWMSFPWTHAISPLQLSFFIEKIFSVIWLRLSQLCLSYIFKSQHQHSYHYKVFTEHCADTNNRIYGNKFSFFFFLKAFIKMFFICFIWSWGEYWKKKFLFLQVTCVSLKNLARCLKVVEAILLNYHEIPIVLH